MPCSKRPTWRGQTPGSKVWLVSLGPKAKLQQVMMTVAQKVPFELVALDGPASGFADSFETAAALAGGHRSHRRAWTAARLLLFGGWESASRGAGSTLQMVGERLGIAEQFQGVDRFTVRDDGSLEILERVEGGKHQVSVCAGPPAVLGWATGNLPEPRNNPQVGMANMRAIMPALQRAKAAPVASAGLALRLGEPAQTAARDAHRQEHAGRRDRPRNRRLDWGGITWNPYLLLAHAEADGTLAKPALEALDRRAGAGRRIDRGVGGRRGAAGGGPDRRLRRRAHSGGHRRSLHRSRATPPMPPPPKRSAAPRERAIVIAPSTSRWARALPGVAYRLGGRVDTHATSLAHRERRSGGDALVLPPAHGSGADAVAAALGGAARCRLLRAVERRAGRGGRWRPWRSSTPPTRTTVTGMQAPKADEQTIRPEAKLLFVAGAGWTKKQADGAVARRRSRAA